MKFTKILAAAMSLTMVCGAETIMVRPYVFAEVPSAYAEEDDQEMTDFYYEGAFYCEEYGDHVVVRRFEDPGANIVIPGEIHGLPVTKIGTTEENTYPNNNKEQYEVITSVVVPDSVKIIGNGMFKDLKNLKTVKLGSGVEYIGQRAFANSGITQIALPKGLKKIDSAMFMNCKSLTTVDLPSTLTEIGEFVFQGCDKLSSVNIPASVTKIDNNAFYQCGGLTSITIPATVKEIGESAFYECTSLKKAVINSAYVSKGMFMHCSALETVELGDNVKNIGENAFQDCKSLKSIKFGKNVEKVGGTAISKYPSLEELVLPESLKEFGGISECNKLKKVTFLSRNCTINLMNIGMQKNASTGEITHSVTIYGYRNSTAQKYAEGNNYPFVALDGNEKGDLNGDSKIDANDATLVLVNYSLLSTGAKITLTEAQKKAADVNGDGKIDASDATLILQYYSYVSTGGADTFEKFLKDKK